MPRQKTRGGGSGWCWSGCCCCRMRLAACILCICLLAISHKRRWVHITWDEQLTHLRHQSRSAGTGRMAGQNWEDFAEVIIQESARVPSTLRLEPSTEAMIQHHLEIYLRSRSSGLPRRSTKSVNCANRIPPLLHQVYPTTKLPIAYRFTVMPCLWLNPDLNYILWTDEDATAFLRDKYPEYAELYQTYKQPLQKSDALRYFILHYFGGIYADMDVQCLKSFSNLAAQETCFFDQERPEQTQVLYGVQFSVMNSVMGCTKRHPFLGLVIENLKETSQISDILRSTGPLFLTKLFASGSSGISQASQVPNTGNRYGPRALPPGIFSPLMDHPGRLAERCNRWIRLSGYKYVRSKFRLQVEACAKLKAIGYGQGLSYWLTNDTLGVHRFMHLGYRSREAVATAPTQGFNPATVHPTVRILRYTTDAAEMEKLSARCFD